MFAVYDLRMIPKAFSLHNTYMWPVAFRFEMKTKTQWQHSKECMYRLWNIAMCDYQESVTTLLTDGQTDAGQCDPYVPLCFAGNTKTVFNPYIWFIVCQQHCYRCTWIWKQLLTKFREILPDVLLLCWDKPNLKNITWCSTFNNLNIYLLVMLIC